MKDTVKRLSEDEILNTIRELTDKLATKQINIKHNTLYNVKGIAYDVKALNYVVYYSPDSHAEINYTRPYDEFIVKFKPKYGCYNG